MKNIYIIADSDPRGKIVGGIGTYSVHLAKNLAKKLNILYIGKKQTKKIKKTPFKTITITKKIQKSNIKFMFSLLKYAIKNNFDKEDIIHAQRPDWLIPFLFSNGKKIVSLHGSHYKNIRIKKSWLLVLPYAILEYVAMRKANKILAVNDETHDEFVKRFPFIKNKITTIPVGVDTTLFKKKSTTSRKKYKYNENPLFLYVGRLGKEKQIHHMISNLKEKEQLIIVGEGPCESQLKQLAKGKNVFFVGSKTQSELVEYYSIADALLLFSSHEGLPTVVLEAFSCGLPAITTPVGHLPQLITKDTGILVKDNDFRGAMDTFLNTKKNRSAQCIKVAKQFDWKKVSQRIYKEVYL